MPRLTRPVLTALAALVVLLVVAVAVLASGGDDEGALFGTEAQLTGTTSVPPASVATTGSDTSSTTRAAATTVPTTRPASTSTRAATQSAPTRDESGLLLVTPAQLPAEARTTLRLIASDGPFPFSRDGIVFENREGRLPKKPRGYYREYTVVTPGASTRGARRIVAGDGGERYYTADHYDSFVRVQT